MTNVKDI